MKIVFVLIILAVILLSAAIIVFFWAVKKRQFDDLEVHAYSILKEDNYEQIPDSKLSENLDDNSKNVIDLNSALKAREANDQSQSNTK